MNIFILSDNKKMYAAINEILSARNVKVDYFCSPASEALFEKEIAAKKLKVLNIKEQIDELIKNYHLGISCHCKQIFPRTLVENVRCVNIHPGFNPYNRGWFPQVFSIISGLPIGATIHEMDAEIDHGAIIAQERVPIFQDDTSLEVYERVLEKEIKLLKENIQSIIDDSYEAEEPGSEGNYNSMKDFNELCKLNLDEVCSMRNAIDKLRALSHGPYNNAYFIDENNNKIYVNISLTREVK